MNEEKFRTAEEGPLGQGGDAPDQSQAFRLHTPRNGLLWDGKSGTIISEVRAK